MSVGVIGGRRAGAVANLVQRLSRDLAVGSGVVEYTYPDHKDRNGNQKRLPPFPKENIEHNVGPCVLVQSADGKSVKVYALSIIALRIVSTVIAQKFAQVDYPKSVRDRLPKFVSIDWMRRNCDALDTTNKPINPVAWETGENYSRFSMVPCS